MTAAPGAAVIERLCNLRSPGTPRRPSVAGFHDQPAEADEACRSQRMTQWGVRQARPPCGLTGLFGAKGAGMIQGGEIRAEQGMNEALRRASAPTGASRSP